MRYRTPKIVHTIVDTIRDETAYYVPTVLGRATYPLRSMVLSRITDSPYRRELGVTRKSRVNHFYKTKRVKQAYQDYRKLGFAEDAIWSLDVEMVAVLYERLRMFQDRVLNAPDNVTVPIFDTSITVGDSTGTVHEWTQWMLNDCVFIMNNMWSEHETLENEAYARIKTLWETWASLQHEYVW